MEKIKCLVAKHSTHPHLEIYAGQQRIASIVDHLADSEALAQLFAAAPELLEACELAKTLLEGLGRENGNVYDDLCNAIKSAKGGE